MKTLTDLDTMPFGKYKGQQMQDVPASYFCYLWNNGMRRDKVGSVAEYIRSRLDALAMEHPDGIWEER